MKRVYSFLIAVAIAASTCFAQMSQEEIIKSYNADVNESIELMQNPSEPWNSGEAFSSFIKKFSTDEEFMKSRIKLTAAQQSEYKDLLVPSNFEAKLPFQKEDAEEGDLYYQMWGEMQYSTVHLDCGWVDSYYTHTFEFKRLGGKWFLSKIVPGE